MYCKIKHKKFLFMLHIRTLTKDKYIMLIIPVQVVVIKITHGCPLHLCGISCRYHYFNILKCIEQMYWISTKLRRFQPSNINTTFKKFISHCVMEYVDNLYTPCAHKGEFITVSHTRLHYICALWLEGSTLLITSLHVLALGMRK